MGIDRSWLLGKTCVGSFGVSEVMLPLDFSVKALHILLSFFLLSFYFTSTLYFKIGG